MGEKRNDEISMVNQSSVVQIVKAFLADEKTGRDLAITLKDTNGADTLSITIGAPKRHLAQ